MSSELNAMYPVLPRGVTTPPGGVLIQMDGPDAADLDKVIGLLMDVKRRRASAEEASRTAPAPASQEPVTKAPAEAATAENTKGSEEGDDSPDGV